MSDSKARELRVQNVRLHQRATSKAGNLTLTRHHLMFTYALDESEADSRKSVDTRHSRDDSMSATPKSRAKPRTKTLWVPYPMINHCVLRPSHLQSLASTPQTHSDLNNNSFDTDDEFPPTFGSSAYGRPSTDSARLAPYASPRRPASPANGNAQDALFQDTGRSPAIRIRCRDFQMMAFHFHGGSIDGKGPDEIAREAFFALRSHCCVEKIEDMLAFHFHPPPQELEARPLDYDAKKEFARMGIGGKAAEGPGSAWRISEINHDYSFSATYPSVLCVPLAVSDNMLKYGGAYRSRCRIPSLAYLHFNGGSITRSSQPMVGVQGKRNPQDERLVSAIFSSHTPPLTPSEGSPSQQPSLDTPSAILSVHSASEAAALDSDVPSLPQSQSETALDEKAAENATPARRKVYGSTRRNFIVDARPKINALANRATGGGIEDVSNYLGAGDVPVEKIFLNIQNIHVMRASLEKVIESMANSDYLSLPPDQELLRKSGWLGHIAGLVEGSDLVARAVGLTGSHVLVHCSDGWDRTSQVSALAQIMLDPHYRTLNGFITLIQKDFLSFGHKFRHRNGIQGSEKWFEIENERITPSKHGESTGSESNSLNMLSTKALSGAKNWFDKNRGSLFRQQNANSSHESLGKATSRPASPPPNPIIHSTPSTNNKEEKEHKTDVKEIAPIFHQFLEAVWQLQRQYPTAFEFNERFLVRLLYQMYACQYGEFLFNCEQERSQYSKRPSVWAHFLARRAEFISPEYAAQDHDALLLPKRAADRQVDVKWWSKLFGRHDKEMNVPRALAPADPPTLHAQSSSVSFQDGELAGPKQVDIAASSEGTLREAKSTPDFSKMKDGISSNLSALNLPTTAQNAATVSPLQRPPMVQQGTDFEVLSKYAASSPPNGHAAETDARQATPMPTSEEGHPPEAVRRFESLQMEDEGDPLGVATGTTKQETAGLDFAAFAAQNSYRDR